jgi:hypothetical protein
LPQRVGEASRAEVAADESGAQGAGTSLAAQDKTGNSQTASHGEPSAEGPQHTSTTIKLSPQNRNPRLSDGEAAKQEVFLGPRRYPFTLITTLIPAPEIIVS